MARTFMTGFAAQAGGVDTLTVGLGTGFSYDTSIKRTGPASLKCVASSGANNTYNTNLPSSAYQRFYVRFTALPSATRRVFYGITGAPGVSLQINPNGTVAYYQSVVLIGTSTIALTDTARWYCIEMRGADGTNVPVLLIDGNVQVVGSPSTWTLQTNLGGNDTVADTYTCYFADFVGDDAALPGCGAVVLLLPISDSARAALWVAGSNATTATTNLWEGVNNTPPVGTATSNAVTAAISHEGGAGGSTDDYDANMTSYSNAGIPTGSTINAVQALIVNGEDIATGAKLLTFSVKSNPAQGAFESNQSVGTGAVGTFPSLWSTRRGTIISTPSVTLGTSPVMTVRRPETASRRADCCLMGMWVDFSPPPVFALSPQLRQAVKRASLY